MKDLRKGGIMKRMFGFIRIIVGIQFIVSASAIAELDTLWTKTYGGTYDDYGFSVRECANKDFIIAGHTKSFGVGGRDIYLVRIDTDGDTLWTKTYGGTGYDYGRSVQECADSGFIITGHTMSFGAGYSDVYLIKTNSTGNTLWTKTYGETDFDYGYSVQECANGNFIIAGYTGFDDSLQDVYLIKTDSNGDTLWIKTYGGTNSDKSYSVEECVDSGFIIVGETKSFGTDSLENIYLIKTDSNGDTLWTKTYGGTDSDKGYFVKECTDSGFIIVGETKFSGTDLEDVYLIRTDLNGDTLWTKTYGGTDSDKGYSVQECADSGFIIVGYTSSFGDGNVYLIKTNTDGDTLWTKTYGGTKYDEGNSVQECAGGGFIIAGYTNSFGAGKNDVYLIKIGPEVGVEEKILKQIQYDKLEIYPNPCFRNALIKYGLSEKTNITLELYNISGKLVKNLYSGTQKKGEHTININNVGTHYSMSLPNGIYFIKFETGNFKETKKLTIIR